MDGDTLSEMNGKAGQRSLPVPDGHGPLLTDVAQGQKEQLGQRLIAGERASVLGELSQAHIHRFDGVGGVDDLADFWWVVKERCQAAPVAPPQLANRQIVRIPLDFKLTQAQLGLLSRSGLVDTAQVSRHLWAALPRDVVQTVAHHVHDAQLHYGLGEHCFDGIWEALEPIDAGDEDVLHTPVAQLRDHLQPELGPPGLRQPQTKNFLLASHGDADGQVHRLDPHSAFARLHMDAVQIDDGVDRVERPGLPSFNFVADSIGH